MTVKTAAKGIRKGYVYDNKWKDRPYRPAWKSGGTQQITDDTTHHFRSWELIMSIFVLMLALKVLAVP